MDFQSYLQELVESDELVVKFEIDPRASKQTDGNKFVCTLSPDEVSETWASGPNLIAALQEAAKRYCENLRRRNRYPK